MWALKQLNLDLDRAGDLRKLQISELEELRNVHTITLGYLNTELRFSMISQFIGKKFVSGQKVLLYNTRLHLFPGKLKTRWSGPYVVQNVSPHGAIEILNPKDGNTFKVNCQRLKPFFTTEFESHNVIELGLCDPVYM